MAGCCGISGDYIYQRLQSAEMKEPDRQLIYDLLFQGSELKEAKSEEEQKEVKGGADGRV